MGRRLHLSVDKEGKLCNSLIIQQKNLNLLIGFHSYAYFFTIVKIQCNSIYGCKNIKRSPKDLFLMKPTNFKNASTHEFLHLIKCYKKFAKWKSIEKRYDALRLCAEQAKEEEAKKKETIGYNRFLLPLCHKKFTRTMMRRIEK